MEYKLAADLKLINILLGISSHSGKYACYLCYSESNLVAGPKRTLKELNKMYVAHHTTGSPVRKMSKYYNVIKPSLITPADLSQSISSIILPPELHLHI